MQLFIIGTDKFLRNWFEKECKMSHIGNELN